MADNKKYYWIKLKTDFFNEDTIDFLLSQQNGCEYVVLYQMLCLQTANNNGIMATKTGEIIIPYDINKITRDTKYFDYDTVAIALELFKKLGLIYEEENKILKITDFEKMIGYETIWAEKKRKYREKQKMIGQSQDNVLEDIEIDKEIEIDKDIDINNMNIIYNFKDNIRCECLTNKNKRCERRSSYNINGKNYCNQHSRFILGKYYGKEKEEDNPDIFTYDWINEDD